MKLSNSQKTALSDPLGPRLLVDTQIINHGPRKSSRIALTFDFDMTPAMVGRLERGEVKRWVNDDLISTLIKTKTPATLFLSGLWIETYKDVAKDLAQNPLFELANHSYSHPAFNSPCWGMRQVSEAEKRTEISKTQQLLKEIGVNAKYFRFPGLCCSRDDLDLINSMGLKTVHGDVYGNDGGEENPIVIVNNVLSNVSNGSIVILHGHNGPYAKLTAVALPQIMKELKTKGLVPVKVSELLGIK